LAALLATTWVGVVPTAIGFFLCGTAAVCAAIVAARLLFLRGSRNGDLKPGWSAAWRMALRNAGRAAGRSTLIVTLLASATFLIIALSAFRIDAESTDRKDSGTGGFALLATAATPLLADLNQPGGRERAGLAAPPPDGENMPVFFPFRASEGDAIGCRNLYRRQQPRLLGATESFLIRGGFRFSETALPSASNPWLLLNSFRRDGVIPVIGDEAAVRWQLHKGLGETIAIRDEQGRSRELRFVALLSGSVLQDELIVSEDAFLDLFPSSTGYSTFLIETPGADAARIDAVSKWLESSLSNWGVDAKSAREKLAEFLAVQNTYLSSFQTLGAFGLMLGALGLTAVMLRNIWERRRETALLAALGFRPRAIRRQILLENAWLIVLGLACGAGPALLAIAPAAAARPTAIPWSVLTLTLGGVSAVALVSAWAALCFGWRKAPASVLKMESS
ncbi:MAG: ABC transporter permease, partial [Planctomycetes bacterium]|nr:ABC transporter permease [Planctomycetota bacterium]